MLSLNALYSDYHLNFLKSFIKKLNPNCPSNRFCILKYNISSTPTASKNSTNYAKHKLYLELCLVILIYQYPLKHYKGPLPNINSKKVISLTYLNLIKRKHLISICYCLRLDDIPY